MPTVLFFRPDEDLAMQYAKQWLSVGVEEARRRGYKVIDLVDAACTFETLEDIMTSEPIDIAILGGHGNPTTFTGFNQQIVMQACTNDQVMTGTISHFLSCSVGQRLLPSIIEKKGISTVGYAVDFQFIVNTEYAVEEDPFAAVFRDLTITIIAAILDGHPLREVWEIGIAKADEWIATLQDRPETDWAEVISCLMHNRDGMIALGDKEAYVHPPTTLLAANVQIPAILVGGVFISHLLFGIP